MEENSEVCELQNRDTKSRGLSFNAGTIPRPGKRAPIRYQMMSDLSTVISNTLKGQTKERASIDYDCKELPFGESIKDRRKERYTKSTEQKFFLICISCCWCASYFKNSVSFTSCPLCFEGKIDSMPIREDENYTVNLSLTKGVELEFSNDIQLLCNP